MVMRANGWRWCRAWSAWLGVAALSLGLCATVHAHDGAIHSENGGVTVAKSVDTPRAADFPMQFGGAFELRNHHGERVTNETYLGQYLLVYFGYVQCKNMCPLTLKQMAAALNLLDGLAQDLTALVITVDPKRDTPAVMKQTLAQLHPRLMGLTGRTEQLQTVYRHYHQNPTVVGDGASDHEATEAIVSHESYIYLMDPQGTFTTLMPPILSPESMAGIIRKYMTTSS